MISGAVILSPSPNPHAKPKPASLKENLARSGGAHCNKGRWISEFEASLVYTHRFQARKGYIEKVGLN